MAKFLITSALPYVNGVKHLGNLAGSLLPPDIHARFRRQPGRGVSDRDGLGARRWGLSGATDVEFRETRHLFLKLPAFEGRLRRWIETRRDWPPLVRSIALKWLDESLKDRCITRDLTWGVPVLKPGFEDKVFYVWFDAPIGYIAAAVESGQTGPR